MSTYTYKKCPKCGKIYERYSTYSKGRHSGSPFRVCKFCKTLFYDNDYKEPAFENKPRKTNLFKILFAPVFPFGVIGFGVLVASIYEKNYDYIWICVLPLIMYFYLVIKGIIQKKDTNAGVMYEYKASYKRVSDKSYVLRLLEYGYDVPKDFLKEKFPDLLTYNRKNNNYQYENYYNKDFLNNACDCSYSEDFSVKFCAWIDNNENKKYSFEMYVQVLNMCYIKEIEKIALQYLDELLTSNIKIYKMHIDTLLVILNEIIECTSSDKKITYIRKLGNYLRSLGEC